MSLVSWLRTLWGQVLFPATPDADARPKPLSVLLLLVLPSVLLYPCLGFHLLEPDEGRYAQIPKEMLDSGKWVVPTLQGEPYLDKPPLMYWLVAVSYKLFGTSEASARLVPAVCVHLTILAVYLLGRRSVGERGAYWAATLLTVAPGFLGIARLLLLDGLLTFCVTTSVLCGFEAVRSGRFRLGWWIASAVFSGLGFLTKGPIAEVLLFPPLWAYSFVTLAPSREGGTNWKHYVLFFAIVIGINVPWYVLMALERPEFVGYFFWEHNVLRFVKPFDHLQPVWYYLPILAVGLLPGLIVGVPFVRSLLGGAAAKPHSPAGGFWLMAGLWCVFFFSVSGSKLPTYILPAYPALCLALGEFVARNCWDKALVTRGIVAAFAGLLALLHYVGLPWYAKERSPMGKPDVVTPYVTDPTVPVVTYPRHVDSVAFYTGRSDFDQVRTKEINAFIVACQQRPRTVILFTHDHSLHGFEETLRGAVDCRLYVTQRVDLRRKSSTKWVDELLGGGPWGLCDIAVVEPGPPRTAQPAPTVIPAGAIEPVRE